MQLRFAAGDDVYEVVDDAFMAARCLHERHAMHLELKPPEMFMTRRIMPVELGIISGMPMLTLEFSATYGLPLMMVLGGTAPEDLMSEANLMTSYFRRGFCADFAELTGLSAVIYAGVIAAIGRGFDDEATLGINTYAKARDSLRGMPPASLLPKIKRYDALITALACLCAGNIEMIGDVLAPEAEAFEADQRRRGGVAIMSTGFGEGENRVSKAIEAALHSPLLNNNDIFNSKKVLLSISFCAEKEGDTLMMEEMNEVHEFMSKFHDDVETKWGLSTDPSLDKKVKITILATGFGISNVPGIQAKLDAEEEQRRQKEQERQEEYEERRDQFYGGSDKKGIQRRRPKFYLFGLDDLDNEEVISMVELTPTYKRSKEVLADIKAKALGTVAIEPESAAAGAVINFG